MSDINDHDDLNIPASVGFDGPTRAEVEALAAKLETQLVMSMFLTTTHLYQEQERQRAEAASALRSLSTPDEVAALVRVAWQEAQKVAFRAGKSVNAGYRDENERLARRIENELRLEVQSALKKSTPTDARAALDRAIAEAVADRDARIAALEAQLAQAQANSRSTVEARWESLDSAPYRWPVLIWHDDFGPTIAERWPEVTGWFETWSGDLITNFVPTHWMPLPEAPRALSQEDTQ